MGLVGGKLSTVAAIVLLAFFVASCGGGDDDSTASDSTAAAQGNEGTTGKSAQGEKEGSAKSKQSGGSGESQGGSTAEKHEDSGGGSAQFKTKGGDNSVQEFGQEGSQSEFDQAAEAVHGFFDARVREDWKAVCSYLAADVSKSLERLAGNSKKLGNGGCAKTMEAVSAGLPRSTAVEAAKADIGSLRVEGDRAFVVYRGAKNLVYAIPVKNEDGTWKVASLAGTPIN